jgi:hypothetical protein
MRKVLPGLYHWTALHEKIHIPVHSYYLAGERVVIDPMVPREGVEWFRRHGPPENILLTNRHHYRHSSRFVKAYGSTVWCHRSGLHEFTRGEQVQAFDHGDELPGGILALEVGALCPEETALYIRKSYFDEQDGGPAQTAGGALAFGDALIRYRGRLGFVPDDYMGEDPEAVKQGLLAAFRRLLRRDFDRLLFAHSAPMVGGGKAALKRFCE